MDTEAIYITMFVVLKLLGRERDKSEREREREREWMSEENK